MGECPSKGSNDGVKECDVRFPKWFSCSACFAGEALEAIDPTDGLQLPGVLVTPSRAFASHDFIQAESPVRMALSQNPDFAKQFKELSPDGVKSRIERVIDEWEKRLKAGIGVSLGQEKVTLAFDFELQCLDVRERGSLYPLAALAECTHLPRGSDINGAFEVLAFFHNSEELVFQFDCGHDRAAFALTLHALASEARKHKWHEDWGEGWEEETEAGDLDDALAAP